MFWKKKKIISKRGTFTALEEKILDSVLENAHPELADKILLQKKSTTHFLRLHYKNDTIIEISSENYDMSDKKTNFESFAEFELAKIVFHCDGKKFESKITCVMGRIFEIKILPSIENRKCEQININEVKMFVDGPM